MNLSRHTRTIAGIAPLLLATVGMEMGAQEICINPGFRIGHTFGRDGGFTVGLEVSLTRGSYDRPVAAAVGAVASWDISPGSGQQKLHVGVEAAGVFPGIPLSLGIEVGPTLLLHPSRGASLALGITPYAGALVYLYYGAHLPLTGDGATEIGLAGKYPVSLTGPIRLPKKD